MALFGDLGSGKTTFVKALAKKLGVEKEITSPTFVIMKKYETNQGDIKELIHIDCYRLSSMEDAESIGFSEILERENAVIVLEWPERVWPLIKKRARKISFEYIDETKRKVTL